MAARATRQQQSLACVAASRAALSMARGALCVSAASKSIGLKQQAMSGGGEASRDDGGKKIKAAISMAWGGAKGASLRCHALALSKWHGGSGRHGNGGSGMAANGGSGGKISWRISAMAARAWRKRKRRRENQASARAESAAGAAAPPACAPRAATALTAASAAMLAAARNRACAKTAK